MSIKANELIQEKYKDIFEIKNKQLKQISNEDNAFVIFLDGKDVTKNHDKYNIYKSDFLNVVYAAMEECINEFKINCQLYIMIDEINIIFNNLKDLKEKNKVDDCVEYITALYVQPFLQKIWKVYPDLRYKFYGFELPINKIEDYLQFRKELCKNIAFTYYCKEILPDFKEFKGCFDRLLEYCESNRLMDKLKANKAFFEGIYKRYIFSNIDLDEFAKMLQL